MWRLQTHFLPDTRDNVYTQFSPKHQKRVTNFNVELKIGDNSNETSKPLVTIGSASIYKVPTAVKKEMGYTAREFSPALYELRDFSIHTPYRGMGVGTWFIQDIFSQCMRYLPHRKWIMKLDVWENNVAAIRCYQKNGFQTLPLDSSPVRWMNQPSSLEKLYNISQESRERCNVCVMIKKIFRK